MAQKRGSEGSEKEVLSMNPAKGFLGLLQAAARVNQAGKELVTVRGMICGGCEHRKLSLLCSKCGCLIPVKVKIWSEECPERKW